MIKKILRTAAILGLVLSLSGVVFAGVDRTGQVTVNSVVQKPPIGPVLDDFNDGNTQNNWGYNSGPFASAGASCTDSRVATSPQEGAYCLKLDYDVSFKDSYSGYWTLLGGESLSAYTSLSFWVKGTAGKELIKIEIKNDSSTAAVYVTEVTTSWQEITIPFQYFSNIKDWTSMKELVFVFENYQSVINGSPTKGTIYIDKIYFGN
jgi:hypothetical protein